LCDLTQASRNVTAKKALPENMRSEQTAKRVLGGAGLSAVIGGIAGNAGMGAAIGAIAGTTAALVQKGRKVTVPSETVVESAYNSRVFAGSENNARQH
jgi:hypothetical protein